MAFENIKNALNFMKIYLSVIISDDKCKVIYWTIGGR